MNFYDYRDRCNHVVRSYKSDIEVDIQIMNEGIRAVFFAHEMGTHAVPLWTLEQLPSKGETRSYLFGEATAREIVNGATSIMRQACPKAIWHYFDGSDLREVKSIEAGDIVADYIDVMTAAFKEKRYPY